MVIVQLENRSRLDGVEVEIFQVLKTEATSKQWVEWLRAPLEHAAAKGDTNLFTRLMDAGADSSAGWRGCHGRTLLAAAVYGKSERIVTALLDAGATDDVNVRFGRNESPLHVAAARGVEKVSKLLLYAGANPNLRDDRKRTPLHVAAEAGHSGIVSCLLLKGARPNLIDGTSLRQNSLHLAASRGHVRCVSELLLGGAGKDALDSTDTRPIHLAALGGHIGVVKELCAAGCNLKFRARNGLSELDLAMCMGHIDVVGFLLAIYGGVNTIDARGYTPLHRATTLTIKSSQDNGPVVRFLLEAGADTEATATALELTPLHRASYRHVPNGTVPALLEAGANVNAIAKDGSTPLDYACEQSSVTCVEVLLRWGADETLGDALANVGTWEEDDSDIGGDHEQRRADDVRIRQMLQRAPADRSWRRRGWLVLCRSCPDKVQLTHDSSASDTGQCDGKKVAKASGEVRRGGSNVVDNQAFDIGRMVHEVVRLEGDGVFRLIVSFL